MTERGLPLADGAPACPFVAFEDDRDERASVPDHRHRCYAESRPSPRALAHQEAYCLSSAFPVCPTFQDWARREAARARSAAEAPPEDEVDPFIAPIVPDRPRRPGDRRWASPPPWSGSTVTGASPDAAGPSAGVAASGMAAGGIAAGGMAAGALGAGAGSSAAGARDGGGLSGSFAD